MFLSDKLRLIVQYKKCKYVKIENNSNFKNEIYFL